MKIKEEKIESVVLCIIEGEIDINTSAQLRKTFEEFVRRNEKKILVEFSQVSYIDSSGLATFIEALQHMKKIGCQLRFCDMTQQVKNAFELTKLHKLFAIFDGRDEALKGF